LPDRPAVEVVSVMDAKRALLRKEGACLAQTRQGGKPARFPPDSDGAVQNR